MSTNALLRLAELEAERENTETEIERIKNSRAYQEIKDFKEELEGIMDKYQFDGEKTLNALMSIDPSLMRHVETGGGKSPKGKRALMRYTNPHSGEVIETRGGNNKTLKEWKAQYGHEEVDSWKERVED